MTWRPERADPPLPLRAKDNGDGTYSLMTAVGGTRQPGDEVIRLAGDPPIDFLAKNNGDGSFSLATFAGPAGNPTFVIGDGQSVVTPGAKGLFSIPFAALMGGYDLLGEGGPGSCQLDLLKTTLAAYPGGFASIVAAAAPAIVNDHKFSDNVLAGWVTQFNASDLVRVSVAANAVFTRLYFIPKLTRR